ncbi:hypothetical protein ACOSP7_029653 [Xanthoceras sorbifolium]
MLPEMVCLLVLLLPWIGLDLAFRVNWLDWSNLPNKRAGKEVAEYRAQIERELRRKVAEEIRYLNSWIEVAAALLISPLKTSNSPRLETIPEEETEEHDVRTP